MSINNYSLIKTNYHILNVDSKEFLFHIPTSSVFELSPESSKLLKQIENNEEIFKYDKEIVEEFKELNILGGKFFVKFIWIVCIEKLLFSFKTLLVFGKSILIKLISL